MAELFAFIFLASFIFLILGLMKPKLAFTKNRKKVLQIFLAALLVSVVSAGCTTETTEENTFEPKLEVVSSIVDDKLEISGETNLPDQTILVVTLKDKNEKDINTNTTVKKGKFQFEPIPVNQLQPGEQTIQITLDEKQPDEVVKVIGENGKLLTGKLVNDKQQFVAVSKVKIPEKKEETKTAKKPTHTSGEKKQIPVDLVETIDGDTIKIIYNGETKNVRYLLIDTPETNHPRLGAQPFGKEAKERNRQLVNSGKLTIEFDVGERVDKYGRLLAYVYVDGKSVQETLLKEGLARVAYVYPPNTRYLDEFRAAEKIAKDKKLGIWSIENYATDSGFNSSAKSSTNQSSSYESSKSNSGTESFKNCTELRKVYPNGVPKDHPAYAPRHDRDKDGWACER